MCELPGPSYQCESRSSKACVLQIFVSVNDEILFSNDRTYPNAATRRLFSAWLSAIVVPSDGHYPTDHLRGIRDPAVCLCLAEIDRAQSPTRLDLCSLIKISIANDALIFSCLRDLQ